MRDAHVAARVAVEHEPRNAPAVQQFISVVAGDESDAVMHPLFIALLTTKYWGTRARTLPVSFTEPTPTGIRVKILKYLNIWSKSGCVRFAWTSGRGTIRITREAFGYSSYLGTDNTLIAPDRHTMSLEAFTLRTSEREFARVVPHEGGHALGFPHEHMRRELVARIDPAKAIAFYRADQGWSETDTRQQVLIPLDDASLLGTPPDETSIMCYQIPGSITQDGKPIVGGLHVNASDLAFNAKVYPKRIARDIA